jgi:hypothetical protein
MLYMALERMKSRRWRPLISMYDRDLYSEEKSRHSPHNKVIYQSIGLLNGAN